MFLVTAAAQTSGTPNPFGPSFETMVAWAVGGVVVVVAYFYHWHLQQTQGQILKSVKKPDEIQWLDDDAYVAFAAICDTILPTLATKDCTEEKLMNAMEEYHPRFYQENKKFIDGVLSKYKKYLVTGAVEYGTPKHAAEALQNFLSADEKNQLFIVLKALSTTPGTLLLTGYFAPFQSLPLKSREKILRGFRDSSLGIFRTLFQAFKRLICVLYFSFAERDEVNPAWAVLDYHPENTVDSKACQSSDDQILRKMISYEYSFEQLKGSSQGEQDVLEVDAIVVGSGCGGGVMAEQLVSAGYNVLVLEKGGYYQPHEFARWRESEAMGNMYDKGGLCTSEDGSVVVLSGSCVGGGSAVNWLASFRTADRILNEWAEKGLSSFKKDGPFMKSLDFVLKRFNVNTDNSYYEKSEEKGKTFVVNENNRLLWKGASKAGFKPEKIPRNTKNCVNCGHCCFGCSHKSKQSSIHTIIEPILLNQHNKTTAKGAGRLFVIPDCKVSRVNWKDGGANGKNVATGVDALVSIYEPGLGPRVGQRVLLSTKKLTVRSKVTVSSCGSIYTPALLLNSKFTHPKIGKYLTLHPVLGAAGLFPDQNTKLETGVSMGVVVKDSRIHAADRFLTPEEKKQAEAHALAIETPPLHLGIFGLMLPWSSGLQFKLTTMMYPHYGVFLGIARDLCSEGNLVTIDGAGNPVIKYTLTPFDEKQVIAGLEKQLEFLIELNPSCMFVGHSKNPWFYYPSEEDRKDITKRRAHFQKYLESIRVEGIVANKTTLYSAHQMSSCRMAVDESDGPTSPSGELFECENLFIADGSVLPTSLGINPMITIEAMSHMIAQNVIQRLQQFK